MASISVSWISWGQMYPLNTNISKIISSNFFMFLFHSLKISMGNTRTFAALVGVWRDWRCSSIPVMENPGEGIQMKVTGLNSVIQTSSISSSPPSWSRPLTKHPSGSRVLTYLPISESHYSIHLPNGPNLCNTDSLRGRNDSMGLPFITPFCKLPLESLPVTWTIIRVIETWINLIQHLYLIHK